MSGQQKHAQNTERITLLAQNKRDRRKIPLPQPAQSALRCMPYPVSHGQFRVAQAASQSTHEPRLKKNPYKQAQKREKSKRIIKGN
jgi:hypothetical protein